jgi:hypothetical protein
MTLSTVAAAIDGRIGAERNRQADSSVQVEFRRCLAVCMSTAQLLNLEA